MKQAIFGFLFTMCVLTSSAYSYVTCSPYRYGSEHLDRQMNDLQADLDRMPRYGSIDPNGRGGYSFRY